MLAQVELAAVFHLQCVVFDAVESVNHAKGLFVGHQLYVWIIFPDQFYGPTVVRFHVVHH